MVPERVIKSKRFQKGDRVMAIAAADDNIDIIGVKGTVVASGSDRVSVAYDIHINGHDLGDRCTFGYGWCTDTHALVKIGT